MDKISNEEVLGQLKGVLRNALYKSVLLTYLLTQVNEIRTTFPSIYYWSNHITIYLLPLSNMWLPVKCILTACALVCRYGLLSHSV